MINPIKAIWKLYNFLVGSIILLVLLCWFIHWVVQLGRTP